MSLLNSTSVHTLCHQARNFCTFGRGLFGEPGKVEVVFRDSGLSLQGSGVQEVTRRGKGILFGFRVLRSVLKLADLHNLQILRQGHHIPLLLPTVCISSAIYPKHLAPIIKIPRL